MASGSVPEGKMFFREWIGIFNPTSILDVGAGMGTYGKILKEIAPSCVTEAVEIWEPNIRDFNLSSLYSKVYCQDILEFSKKLSRCYDLIIMGDVLEHLSRAEAIETFNRLKTHCRFLYLSLPLVVPGRQWSSGWHWPQPPEEYAAIPSEKHLYNWKLDEVVNELGPFMWQLPFRIVGVFIAEGSGGDQEMIRKIIDLKSKLSEYKCEDLKVLNVGAGGDAVIGLPPQLREIRFKQLDHLDAYDVPLEKTKGVKWSAKTVNFILEDIRNFDFSDYDLLLMFDVVEHLPKADALEILRKIKHAFIFIPLETGELMDGEGIPFGRHLSRWTEQEFIDLGFRTEVLRDFHSSFGAMWAEK